MQDIRCILRVVDAIEQNHATRRFLAVPAPILVTVLFLSLPLPLLAQTFGDIVAPEIVRVYDGDTFFVDIAEMHPIIGEEIGIRVRGIDTPEIRGSCERERALARRARDRTTLILADAETIVLRDIERGRYFRIVATVIVDGRDLAAILLEEGLAVPYDGTTSRPDWCE